MGPVGAALGSEYAVHTGLLAHYASYGDLDASQLLGRSEIVPRFPGMAAPIMNSGGKGGWEAEQGFRFKVCSLLE